MLDMSDRPQTVYVAGHRGLVGSALVRRIAGGKDRLVVRTHDELDLTQSAAVRRFFEETRPDVVYLAAAKVGGILANRDFGGDFIRENIAIQLNVLESARLCGVKRLLFLGSSCIYPRECPQPIKEDYLLTGPLEATNRPYAVAKISGIEMCGAYNRQYGTSYIAAMPTNLFGPFDNYDLSNSHVLPALIRRFHEAKTAKARSVEAWGTGSPRREFLFSDDLADACVKLIGLSTPDYDSIARRDQPLINIGTGRDISILELTELVKEIVGFEGRVVWNTEMPDGTPRKLLDVSRLTDLGWKATTPLRKGIELAYSDFCARCV